MPPIPFAAVLAAALAEEIAVPLALRLLRRLGCALADDCPADESLEPSDLPTGDDTVAALDRLATARRSDADEILKSRR